jgi:hypothetical protein
LADALQSHAELEPCEAPKPEPVKVTVCPYSALAGEMPEMFGVMTVKLTGAQMPPS